MKNGLKKACEYIVNALTGVGSIDPRITLASSVLLAVLSVMLTDAGMEVPGEFNEGKADLEVIPEEDGIAIEGLSIDLKMPIPVLNTEISFNLVLPETDDYIVLKVCFGGIKLDARIKIRKSVIVG